MGKKYSAGIDILGEKSNIRDYYFWILLKFFFALKVIQLFEGINEMKPNKIMQNERDKIFKFCFNDKQTIFSKKQIIRKKCRQNFFCLDQVLFLF